MNRVIHFEIQAVDMDRAAKFYTDIFGWTFQKWEGMENAYWMIMTAPEGSTELGINGGLLKRPTDKMPPQECGTNAFTCTIDVKNFDETSEKILEAGGKIALPKMAIPNMAWLGYFLDTENNTFGIFQEDKEAKNLE